MSVQIKRTEFQRVLRYILDNLKSELLIFIFSLLCFTTVLRLARDTLNKQVKNTESNKLRSFMKHFLAFKSQNVDLNIVQHTVLRFELIFHYGQ